MPNAFLQPGFSSTTKSCSHSILLLIWSHVSPAHSAGRAPEESQAQQDTHKSLHGHEAIRLFSSKEKQQGRPDHPHDGRGTVPSELQSPPQFTSDPTKRPSQAGAATSILNEVLLHKVRRAPSPVTVLQTPLLSDSWTPPASADTL